MKPFKWFVIGVGTLVGVAHIGVLGHVIRALEPTPVVVTHPPVGDYTSYTIEATPGMALCVFGWLITRVGVAAHVVSRSMPWCIAQWTSWSSWLELLWRW